MGVEVTEVSEAGVANVNIVGESAAQPAAALAVVIVHVEAVTSD